MEKNNNDEIRIVGDAIVDIAPSCRPGRRVVIEIVGTVDDADAYTLSVRADEITVECVN